MTSSKPAGPITLAVVGAGHRAKAYANFALTHPDRAKVVAVADPDPLRRDMLAKLHQVPAAMQFSSYEALAQRPRLADAIINGTMDQVHYRSSVPLLNLGYHMLLEKPIACSEQEVRELIELAQRNKSTVMICHVLRYAPFYRQVHQLLRSGQIGQVVSMHLAENVSYHHMAVGFVRGKWNNTATSNPMLLAKCCHDLDLIAWLLSGVPVTHVASFGSLMQFRPENAPEGATDYCLGGCKVEPTCQYSARTNYLVQKFGFSYPFEEALDVELTEAQKIEMLKTNRYGRCVWRCDNDVVDHQNVIINFANGSTATLNMFCATARPSRTIHINGTLGEIEGDFEHGVVKLRKPELVKGKGFSEELFDTKQTGGARQGGHGGGDRGLIDDFIAVLQGEQASPSVTRIEDSLTGHLMAFAADEAMRNKRVVEVSGAAVGA